MTIHHDLPTLKDGLRWSREITRMIERIKICGSPHVMGIHGDWGSGKTSFMRQVQHGLGGDIPNDGSVDSNSISNLDKNIKNALNKEIITIWFDAWRYQNEPAPVVALLHEMRQQMATLPALKQKFNKIGEIALGTILNVLPDIGKSIGFEGLPSADKIQERGEKWEKAHFSEELGTNSIRKHLLETIKTLLPTNSPHSKIVIFIDDLDRCNPKAAIRLLEGLKVYFSIPYCVFVIGMNERILVDVISEEVSDGAEDKKLRASHYLEKICSDIYRLPIPSSALELFINWVVNPADKAIIREALSGLACLPPNPRRLKSLANQWERFACYIPHPEDAGIVERKIWAVRVLIAAYIHQFHRDLWERWHYEHDFWNEIKNWCSQGYVLEDYERTPDAQIQPLQKDLISAGWVGSLKLAFKINTLDESFEGGKIEAVFYNPGDIDIFWIGSLIFQYRDDLAPRDFLRLIKLEF